MRIDAGAVTVAGKALLTLPLRQWVHVEIVSPVRKDNSGVLEMTFSLPDGERRRFRDLPFQSGKAFDGLGWLGFICTADANAAFYIDNLRLEAVP